MAEFIDMHAVCVRELMAPVGGKHGVCDVSRQLVMYDRLGVAKGVIMPIANVETHPTGQANEEVLRIVEAYPSRFSAFCNLDPRNCYNSPTARFTPVLEHYKSRGCRGVGCVAAKLPISDVRVQNLFQSCEEASMPVSIHLDGFEDKGAGLYDPPSLAGLKATLARFPKLTFLVSGAAFWCEISVPRYRDERVSPAFGPVKEGMLRSLLEAYPNLVCNLSGPWGAAAIMRDKVYAASFLTGFKDRIVFGLDAQSPETVAKTLPVLPSFLRRLRDEGSISVDVFDAVASGNAKRIARV